MQAIRKYIESYVSLSGTDWDQIAATLEMVFIKKDTILLEEGKICRYLYFLESGLMRFYIMKDGKDITKFFTDAPFCFTSQVSFTKGLPAQENIEALEDSVIWQMPVDKANQLLQIRGWSDFVRILIQQVQSYTESILQELQTVTAEERYRNMLMKEPQLVQRIPLKYLASYLGIAPQSLSRIRKQLSKAR
ncbi:Crp/Fnr family transcriptional regulator [Flavihumibacter cheonanensis]|uniref:Crp/Fnr family transcriptional regulator n=1 Tax=Flavihumibacter cheonanensis TaxID=1442385 RepID=UPI001EF8BC4B|nr:Crp/Fnr family transcriptional regulator [Flavihumibacter cheonanensis]MCG7752797.1 Crp/Fnr family transcriptional regulator [Flavihumibacter cheonanensis]